MEMNMDVLSGMLIGGIIIGLIVYVSMKSSGVKDFFKKLF